MDTLASSPAGPESPAAAELPIRKPRPNHQLALRILRSMTPRQKLDQVFKLNERVLRLMQ